MFDTIILLTGPAEQPVLSDELRRHNPHLSVRSASALDDLRACPPAALQRARLIAFASSAVVPADILSKLGYGAYNFHPGPPSYPGRTPAHFAIYDGASEFGATAHVMVERVDAGPIVGVELFAIPPGTDVLTLSELVYQQMARLFWRLAADLATQAAPLPVLPVEWCGRKSSLARYAELCAIAPTIAKNDLDRRIAAFGHGHFGIDPTVTLHGHRFRYVAPEVAVDDTPSIAPEQPVTEAAE